MDGPGGNLYCEPEPRDKAESGGAETGSRPEAEKEVAEVCVAGGKTDSRLSGYGSGRPDGPCPDGDRPCDRGICSKCFGVSWAGNQLSL